jgi:hypothetical protein
MRNRTLRVGETVVQPYATEIAEQPVLLQFFGTVTAR